MRRSSVPDSAHPGANLHRAAIQRQQQGVVGRGRQMNACRLAYKQRSAARERYIGIAPCSCRHHRVAAHHGLSARNLHGDATLTSDGSVGCGDAADWLRILRAAATRQRKHSEREPASFHRRSYIFKKFSISLRPLSVSTLSG
jgi:hypothetical protein